MKKFRGNKTFRNYERKNRFEVEIFGHKHSVNWNETNLILNWSKKDCDLLHIDPNRTV